MSRPSHIPGSQRLKWVKLLRYARTYGWKRTLTKVAGHTRPDFMPGLRKPPDPGLRIGLIGCGQFAYSTICYFLREALNPVFAGVYDPDAERAASLARHYQAEKIYDSPDALLADTGISIVYIASDHASHAAYAVKALLAGKKVYVEKPIATNWHDFGLLQATTEQEGRTIVAGYNRPYAPAVQELKKMAAADHGPFTLQCAVHTHLLPHDHWYRQPEQGTRICGNMGHWLDLAVHLLFAGPHPPKELDIAMNWANDAERDDNLSVVLSSSRHDLITITMSARHEPLEGIEEQLLFQNASGAARIDDFRRAVFTSGARTRTQTYHPKDPGHRTAVLQPFMEPQERRSWQEVLHSTRLMLTLTDMLREGRRTGSFSFFPDQQSSFTP